MSAVPIPLKTLDQHAVVLGKTGSGKSSKLRVLVENLLSRNKRVCILDPKGDWWGLKVSADGKGPGFPVILFGDFKDGGQSDVPINDQSGDTLARLIASGNRPCVIGMRGWTHGAMTRFWVKFAESLFRHNSGELYLVGDEFHNFAPKNWKQTQDRETPVTMGLHWANKLLAEGRGLGLVCLIASQRPQKVHNDTLTSCETLMALRVVHAADRKAIQDWIDGNGDREVGREVLDSLANLDRAEAWVWSPEIGYGPKRVKFPLFSTFDSFAPPQTQAKVSSSGWAGVDLAEVKAALVEEVRRAEENDPRLLKKKIAALERQIEETQDLDLVARANERLCETQAALAEVKEEVELIREDLDVKTRQADEAMRLYERIRTKVEDIMRDFESLPAMDTALPTKVFRASAWDEDAKKPKVEYEFKVKDCEPSAKSSRKVSSPEGTNKVLGKGEEKILTACIQHKGCTKTQLTVLTGYKRSSRDAYIQRLKAGGMVEVYGDGVVATREGIEAVPNVQPLPTGAALRQHWLNTLPAGESEVLALCIKAWPDPVHASDVSNMTGYKRSSRDAYIQRLSARKLVERVSPGIIKCSSVLFK